MSQNSTGHYDKPTANVVFNGEKLKVLPLRLEATQVSLHSLFLFTTVLEILARSIRQDNAIKGTQIRMGEVKFSLVPDDMIS